MVGVLAKLIRSSDQRVRREHIVAKPYRLPASLAELAPERRRRIEEMVILGVLMQLVAHADEDLSEQEEKTIRRILLKEGSISSQEAALVIGAAREARESRPEIQGFTREVSKRPYGERVRVVELLFHIAFADKKLSLLELETIRKIARLFWLEHKDFTDAKLRVADQLGLREKYRAELAR